MTRCITLLLLALLAAPVAAQPAASPPSSIAGLWAGSPAAPLSLAKDAEGLAYGAIVRKDGRLHHLTLERTATGWQLLVREESPAAAARGAAGALEGRASRATWAWEAPRAIPLQEQGETLAGGGFRLQHPLRQRAREAAPPGPAAAGTIVVGHRGSPTRHCENTLPALRAALAEGATGLEIDLCLTKDGQVVLWHDAAPNDLVALIRNHGLEGDMAYMPNFPALGNRHRKPVHELDLADLRANFGYSKRRFTLSALDPDPEITIPTFEEVAPFLAKAKALRLLVLDVKVPKAVGARFAQTLAEQLERFGLSERCVFMHADAEVLSEVKGAVSDEFGATHDIEIKKFLPTGDPTGYSAVAAALRMGNRFASVGRPRLMLWGGLEYYLDVLRHDRARIDGEGLDVSLIAWTINEAAELSQVLSVGVDGVLTDYPRRAAGLVRQAEASAGTEAAR
jgi:glycerophosphoryl diester phosphodiesterase